MELMPFWRKSGRSGARSLFVVLLMALPLVGQCALSVVTTTPDLRSITEAIGGERVHVTSLVPDAGDAENYVPRPQDIERLHQAQVVVRIGLDYDLWLDKLTSKAANPAIVRGGKGLVDASGGITLLEVKTGGFGGDGHAHGAGNPHYWLDPENAVYITANITGALARVDPAGSKFYEQKRNEFLARLKTMIPVWQSKLAPLNGLPIVMYHNTWPYFGRRFRLNFAASIELKPGVPPSPSALASLLHRIREEHISVIVREPQEPSRDVDFLAEKTGSRVAVMAASIGDTDQARDYFSLFDANVAALVAAFSGHPK
jgi:ABC-type Zn uptake system ZnuABC Zn-binding protein ZnuA